MKEKIFQFIRKSLPMILTILGALGSCLSAIFKKRNEAEAINSAVKNYLDEKLKDI